jgi:amino acid transporter
MIACMLTFTILAIAFPFIVCAQAPGTDGLAGMFLPLNPAYSRMFNMPVNMAGIFSIPGTFATGLGFFYIGAKQLAAMSKSGFLPSWLGRSERRCGNAPVMSYLIVTALSLVVEFLTICPSLSPDFLNDFFLLSLLGSYVVYIGSFVAFIAFRSRLCGAQSPFVNPVGISSAVVGIVVFFVAILSVVAFQGGNYRVIIMYVGYLVVCAVFYFCYSSKQLHLSDAEQSALFTAYVMKGRKCLS